MLRGNKFTLTQFVVVSLISTRALRLLKKLISRRGRIIYRYTGVTDKPSTSEDSDS